MDAPAPSNLIQTLRDHDDDDDDDRKGRKNGTNYSPGDDDEYGQPDDPAEEFKHEMDPWLKPYEYLTFFFNF